MAEGCHMTVKIILLGDYNVDKGTLLRTISAVPKQPDVMCLGFRSGYVEMLMVRDEKRIRVKLNDTGGQERFRSITSSYYRGAHGCILMFDVTKRATFECLNEWHKELYHNSVSDDVVVTLAGCKSHMTGSERQVSRRTAQEFANYLEVPYEELNVKDLSSVLNMLGELIDRIILQVSRSPFLSLSIKPLDQKGEVEKVEKTKCAC